MPSDNPKKPGSRMPTRAELNAEISIDASPEEVIKSLSPKTRRSKSQVRAEKMWRTIGWPNTTSKELHQKSWPKLY